MARITLNDEMVLALIDAIVTKAADDYRIGRRGLKRKNLSQEMTDYYTWCVSDAETFFHSQWFYMMGGSPAMFKQLKRQCDRGYYRLRKGWGNETNSPRY